MLRFASMHQVLVASNKTKLLMLYSIGSLVLNFVLNIAFFYMFGLIGPAIAALVTAILYAWLVLHKSMKLIDAKWTDIFNLKEMGWLLLTLGGLWLVCHFLHKGLTLLGLHPYLSMILSMAVFGCSALAIHFKPISGVLKKINTFRI